MAEILKFATAASVARHCAARAGEAITEILKFATAASVARHCAARAREAMAEVLEHVICIVGPVSCSRPRSRGHG